MNVFWLLFVFLLSQSEALQRLNWFAKNWRSQIRDEYLPSDLNPRNTIWRLKPKITKNLLGLRPQDASPGTGFKVQGTAQLKGGKVKLDLTVQGASHLGDPSATTAPSQTPTSAPGSTATTGAPTSSVNATTSTTVGGPAGSISTLPVSTTAAPTTSAITSGPTGGGAKGTTAKPTAATTSATASSGTGPETSMPSPSAPPTTVTAAHVKNAVSTEAAVPTTGPSTPSGTTSTPTTLPPSKSATVVPTGTKTTVATMTTSQPSPSQLPGFLSKPFCEKPIDVSTKIVAKEILKSHNDYRRTHAASPLQLDVQMMCDAQTFAQEIAARGVLQHQKSAILARKRLGENIGMSCAPARGGPLSYGRIMKMAKNVARRWYDEVCQYDFDKPSAVPKTGHFTEIVWSGTKKFGIGFAVGKNARFPEYKCVYVVGRYSPAGNIIGERQLQMNVRRGSFNKSYCQKRSTALQEDPWDKRNHLRPLDKPKRRSHIHSRHHFHHHGYE